MEGSTGTEAACACNTGCPLTRKLLARAQERALGLIKPGAQWHDVDQAAREVILARLKDMGLVSKKASTEALLAAKVDRWVRGRGRAEALM